MAIAHVQSAGAQSSGTVASLGVTFGSPTTTNNLICVGFIIYNVGTFTVTDGVNTYGQDVTKQESEYSAYNTHIWHTYETSGASRTVTVTNTAGNKYTTVSAAEFSGVDSGQAPSTNSNEANSSTVTAGSVDSTAFGNGALYFASMSYATSGTTITPDGGFSEVYENESAVNVPISTIYQVQGTAGALNAGWTLGGARRYPACVAVFKASGGSSYTTSLFRSNAGVGSIGGGPFSRSNAGLGVLA